MAKIEDLVKRIADEKLREEIAAEVRELKKHKQFGLVFEEHLPEVLRLPKVPIRVGNLVVHREAAGNDLWRVVGLSGKKARCRQPVNPGKYGEEKTEEFPVAELVLVVSFGEPIYPVLTPVDRIARGGPDKPWHVLINADNYHALQLLLYGYERKVDVIYIDPPYNTGARDWKYNNDYVDKTDAWRHSKWLSMMKKRLALARRLLKSDGVLVITIDDNELAHLKLLLEELFTAYDHQIATIIINPGGAFGNNLSAVHEYAIFSVPKGLDLVQGRLLTPEEEKAYNRTDDDGVFALGRMRKRGVESLRADRVSMFYAVYVDPKTMKPAGVGPDMKLEEPPIQKLVGGKIPVYPIDEKGIERRWSCGRDTMLREIEAGNVVAEKDRNGITKLYKKERLKAARRLNTVWTSSEYSAGDYGSRMVNAILGKANAFPFPKSLYAVRETLASVCRARPDALILDFFAGSGTTFHATALLNAEDNGRRRCVLITNNEVGEKMAKQLNTAGHNPGDPEFEKHGIAEAATWPRCKTVINGKRDDGSPLSGEYLTGRQMSDGLPENLEYFRMDFIDPAHVERGDAFEGIMPILWMMAGAMGERESRRGASAWYLATHSPFAVLLRETKFSEFEEKLRERKDIHHVFLVTDSDDNFALMRHELGRKYKCVQLYKSYLDNFRVNTVDPYAAGKETR